MGGSQKPRAQPPPAAAPPLARAPSLAHHWLALTVARAGPLAPIPAIGARVVVRPFPRGAARPEEPVARGTTGPDGTLAVSLPAGRYAVYAQQGDEGKAVTITLHHDGRATLILEEQARRIALVVEVFGPDGLPLPDAPVDVRTAPGGVVAARARTDVDGVAKVQLPSGAYEVRTTGAAARTYLEADTVVRLHLTPADGALARDGAESKYVRWARAATRLVTPMETEVKDETFN